MTTFVRVKLECSECSGKFFADTLASFGFAKIDIHLCKEYWGFNPMPLFYAMCPHCKKVDATSNFDKLEDNGEDFPLAQQTCDNIDRIIVEEREGENSNINLAYLYHQSACCRKVEGQEYPKLLKKAHQHFQLAKREGINEFLRYSIDDWIEATKM